MNKSNWFSIDDAIRSSWGVFKKTPLQIIGFFVLLGFTLILNSFIFNYLIELIGDSSLAWLQQLESWLFGALLQIAVLTFVLNLLSTQKTAIVKRLTDPMLILKVLVGTLLSSIVFMVGFILLIVPGIVFAVRLSYVNYLIIDKGMGPIEAIKESWRITANNFFSLLGFGVTIFLLNLFGLVLLVVGLFITIPLSMLASAYVYRKLLKAS